MDQAARDLIRNRTDRTLFVSAGAGSGKTSALVGRVARLVLDDGVAMGRIATVTFTIKAGSELKDRLREEFEAVALSDVDTDRRNRAAAALDDLDLAAIGTLHAFAQRILAAHPIEARIPPAIEVLDEVASSIAFDERWTRIQQDLLDDDAIAEPLIVGMAAGVKLDQVRQLVRLLGLDWDRVESHVLFHPPAPLQVPDLMPATSGISRLHEIAALCTDDEDRLADKVGELLDLLTSVSGASTLRELLETIAPVDGFKTGNVGKAANWPDTTTKQVRDELVEIRDRTLALRNDVVGQCLRHLTHWAGTRVLNEALERRRSGRLEFHDLLVLARNLLAHSPDVRAALHERYQRLLLDEFQDTDPIQIELAVRIAAGREGSAPDWKDIDVPPGRLFVVGDAKQSIYRFRRASIKTYLDAQRALTAEGVGDSVTLATNFRSGPGVIDWVNHVFGELISFEKDAQPPYEALAAHRDDATSLSGPAVTVLGAVENEKMPADELRRVEAEDVAAVIVTMLQEQWTVYDHRTKAWRPVRPADIAILIPSRTSMPILENALDAAGVHFRAESMSLVYEAAEVRDLLVTARAIADPSDALALVAALRSPLFACGDDDLWRWRRGGGRFDLFSSAPTDDLQVGPVGRALDALRQLHRAARWLTPSEVLATIARERRAMEISAGLEHHRDSWRRIRFVIDQARAWTEVAHGGLRAYLAWVGHQATEKSRASEAILPENDVDAVRVMTVHAAKGLEFPVVVMSGMSTRPMRQYGVRLLWNDDNYAVSLRRDLQDPTFEGLAAIDEQMGDLERTRLLYVAATRARDHLVVSLHRSPRGGEMTPAERIHAAGGAAAGAAVQFEAPPRQADSAGSIAFVEPPPSYEDWWEGISRARRESRRRTVVTASGLEGTEPEVAYSAAEESGPTQAPGAAKGPRDLELPPWTKGRYGSQVGRAVHAVLQVVDLSTGEGLDDAVRVQALAEGILDQTDLIRNLVRSAFDSEIVRRASSREHWREIYLGAPGKDGVVMEGIVDLLYREDDGTLVIVDYKTDAVPAGGIAARAQYYRPQLEAYRDMLAASVAEPIEMRLLFLHPDGGHLIRL